jgi:hypothetical protein
MSALPEKADIAEPSGMSTKSHEQTSAPRRGLALFDYLVGRQMQTPDRRAHDPALRYGD